MEDMLPFTKQLFTKICNFIKTYTGPLPDSQKHSLKIHLIAWINENL